MHGHLETEIHIQHLAARPALPPQHLALVVPGEAGAKGALDVATTRVSDGVDVRSPVADSDVRARFQAVGPPKPSRHRPSRAGPSVSSVADLQGLAARLDLKPGHGLPITYETTCLGLPHVSNLIYCYTKDLP